jgi:GntR family transcriptional regulator/MocR family aminotransferase
MKYKIVLGHSPAYLQLYNQIKKDIVAKAYPYGAKLPSKRLLAEETGVSVITIEHAYELLVSEGYAESKQRSGYYVIYRERDFISHVAVDDLPHDVKINLQTTSQTGVTFPFSVLSKAMRKVICDYGESLLVKSHNKGVLAFRQELCSYLKRTVDIDAAPDQIIIGAGAEYLYGLVVQLLGKNKIYAIENPSYNKIRQVYTANGVMVEPLQMGKNGIITSDLASSRANVLHVTPYNSFPSMVTASVSKRNEYLHWANGRNGYIVEDNYDSELTISKKNEETLFSLSTKQNVIYINTFSKTLSSGIRVGYMLLPKTLVQTFEQNLGFYSCTVPVFEQLLLTELLSSGEFERHVNRVRRQKRKK